MATKVKRPGQRASKIMEVVKIAPTKDSNRVPIENDRLEMVSDVAMWSSRLTTKAEPRRHTCQPRMRTYRANRRRLRRIVRRRHLSSRIFVLSARRTVHCTPAPSNQQRKNDENKQNIHGTPYIKMIKPRTDGEALKSAQQAQPGDYAGE
jgi:hypothetical protein